MNIIQNLIPIKWRYYDSKHYLKDIYYLICFKQLIIIIIIIFEQNYIDLTIITQIKN
jgi:hypothetical protein